MGDKTTDSSTKSQAQPLHPVYTVTDIQKKVRVFDGSKVTYSAWVKLFQLHARGYEVLDHITEKPPPKEDPTYDQWMKIDAIVLQWIYGTLSKDYLLRVLEAESTALEAWDRVKAIFLNNKGPRCAALQQKFINLKLSAMPSLEAYCQTLRDLAAQLTDVGNPINEQTLVLQLVRGLPMEFDTIGSIINQSLPTWEEACNMLHSELERHAAREVTQLTPSEALAAVTSSMPPPRRDNNARRDGPNRSSGNRRNGAGRGDPTQHSSGHGQNHYQAQQQPTAASSQPNRGQKRGTNQRGNWAQSQQPTYSAQTAYSAQNQYPMPPYWASPYWAPPPPCQYPTQPGWVAPWQPTPRPNHQQAQPFA
ncbi:uncharacterized protein LOC118482863 [Helianthus annuus]|uniref:uncharacterized protein LOC118482863 n=1 Tax=Helianthus annuus TaxID=4232 RepID=UPI001652F698|nr:uncharacterized protein LOC118482863 [Helianthus annuus]